MLNDKKELEKKIIDNDKKLQAFENKISDLEGKLREKAERNDINTLKKKNILQRIEDIEKRKYEKDIQMQLLSENVEVLENRLKQKNYNTVIENYEKETE